MRGDHALPWPKVCLLPNPSGFSGPYAGWWVFLLPLGVFTSASSTLWKQLPGMRALHPVSAVLMWVLVWAGGERLLPAPSRAASMPG